ncbi:aliphatic sulfonate ABC transporter substrate-binding protein [Blastopirellula retiformator]|uniref:Putative aliphatic sulfonates-binding protein n=1 Tax=Blastopirellula retiformator TaxID=2527970 RepID=A0A5C5V754_9BACT|nr:aliphatic sulfonate ABC transporter substrate-binding protein [Blastopirellula retiformator]TWT34414.1 putative aliphatic sulfonates-binding protein precursor [Blastopirellula retiformator]
MRELPNIQSRSYRSATFVAALLLVAIGCSPAARPAPENGVVRVSLQPVPAYAPLWIAKRKGWLEATLKEAKLGDVEWSTLRDGPLQNEALAAGLIDVALTADTPAIIGRSAGLDVKIVSLAAVSPESLAILLPADSPIRSVSDLESKKVAATKGSFCHHLLALALQREGLSLSSVRFINMSGPEINTSLQTGQIDAGATWEPYISQVVSNGSAKILLDGANLKSGNEVILVTSDLIEHSPETVTKILEVFRRGRDFLREHPEEAAQLIAEDVNLEPEQLVATFPKIEYIPPLSDATLAELDATQKFLLDLGVNRQSVDISEFVDLQFDRAAFVNSESGT